MADKEYSSTDAAHGLPGFSANSQWEHVQESGVWSHYPDQPGPKAGFHDPVQAGPARKSLWQGANEGDAADAPAAEWPASSAAEPGTLGQKGIPDGAGGHDDGAYSAGRHDGTQRGNSPWWRGGPH